MTFIKRSILVTGFISFTIWTGIISVHWFPQKVYAEKQVLVSVPQSEDIPILERIMTCESSKTQIDSKTGQVVLHPNNDGSVDIGIMQINIRTWGKTATSMGYDLTKESDNRAFGRWLFLNKGSAPWSASSSCWNK